MSNDVNCEVGSIRMEERKLKIDTCCGEPMVSGGCWRLLAGGLNCNTRIVRTAVGAISENGSLTVKLDNWWIQKVCREFKT